MRPRDRDRYEILGEIAVGGMATVYLARLRGPLGFHRLVAVKHMHPQFAADAELTSMFIDEARLTARLRHPNIVSTLDIVADDGQLLLVMELVDGESLAAIAGALAREGKRMPVGVACALVYDALLGLHEAHEATDDDGVSLAVVHRDVSPQNIIVGVDGLARVLDFGIAKARRRLNDTTGEGIVKGKMRYMPPEQLFGEAIDRRADVYAAGVVLWELLCGRALFDGPPQVIAVKVEEGAIAPPSMRADGIPPELDAIVLKALASHPSDRFSSALEMAEAVAGCVALPRQTNIASWLRGFVPPRSSRSSRSSRAPAATPFPRESSRNRIVAALEKAALDVPLTPIRESSRAPEPAPPPSSPVALAPLSTHYIALALGAAGLVLAFLAFVTH